MATAQIEIGKLKSFFIFLRGLFQRYQNWVVMYNTEVPVSFLSALKETGHMTRHQQGTNWEHIMWNN